MAHLYNNEDRRRSVFIVSNGKHLGTRKAGGGVGTLNEVTAAQSPFEGLQKRGMLGPTELEETHSRYVRQEATTTELHRQSMTFPVPRRIILEVMCMPPENMQNLFFKRVEQGSNERQVPEYNLGHLSIWTSVCLPWSSPFLPKSLATYNG